MGILLNANNLSKTYGVRSLFEAVSLSIHDGERVGLIGPNGSGKSTLLKLLAGLETPDLLTAAGESPEITTRRNLRVGYVAQSDDFDPQATLSQVVADALTDTVQDEHDRQIEADMALSQVGLDDFDQKVGTLSGGWRKRLAIAQQIARDPEILLLDEPTNHLDMRSIEWLEKLLQGLPFATVIVTHDRYFLERAVTRIVELSRAYPTGTFAVDGPYSTFLKRRAEFLHAQAQQQQGLAAKVREDIKWLSRGAKARRTKSKSRIDASHQRMDDLAELKFRNAPDQAAGLDFTASGRKTKKLLEATGLRKSLGGRLLFDDLDLLLAPGTRVGLLGENGSGKTTLIRLLTGELEPDAGTIKRADGLRTVVFTQNRAELDMRQPLRDALCPGSDFVTFRDKQIHVNAWAQRFLFRPDQFNASVGDLSGGEQARILIARLMLKPADLLILDEPTNDLDIASLEVLEQSLVDFPGAVLLVTHDRYMLDRLSTEILALDGKGDAHRYAELAQWLRTPPTSSDDVPATSVASGSVGAATATAPPKPKKKLSYKDQRELDQMESTITKAEAEVEQLEAETTDPAVMADHVKLQDACRRLEAAHTRVTELYARWEELGG
ncbi:MAG: ABC-F family ATP-binding cassette domain-containing protein [Phycisphaeraceae bacterium]